MTEVSKWVSRVVIGGLTPMFFAGCSVAQDGAAADGPTADSRPNVILVMADDLGWGDVGFHGNENVKTPNLDAMAADGMQLTRFYTASSICSPTRASVMTGRHPFRTGILAAHTAGMRTGEVTVGEAVQTEGYETGFFGKWHLGWLESGNRIGRGFYSPVWQHGFDETFATTNAVPTYNPQSEGENYFHNGKPSEEELTGDDSKIIMDKAIPFIEKQAESDTPFLATIWFHTPHEPVIAGPEYLEMYKDLPVEKQRHLYGAITAMDVQIGRLRAKLRDLGIEKNTVVFFTSDNGPDSGLAEEGIASAGPYRKFKHWHYDGGVHVASLVEWPGTVAAGSVNESLTGTVDYFPTVMALAGVNEKKVLKDRPIDGESLLPILEGKTVERETGIVTAFRRLFRNQDGHALIEGNWKLIRPKGKTEYELYNLKLDPSEKTDVAAKNPKRVEEMGERLTEQLKSYQLSRDGADYTY